MEKSFYAIDSVKNPIATFDCIAVAKNELAKYNIQADATSIISSNATSKADHGTESFMWSNEAPNHHIHLQTNYGQNIYSANYQPNSPVNASPLNYVSIPSTDAIRVHYLNIFFTFASFFHLSISITGFNEKNQISANLHTNGSTNKLQGNFKFTHSANHLGHQFHREQSM